MTRAATLVLAAVACVALGVSGARAQLSVSPQSASGSSNQTVNVDVTLTNPGAVPIDAFGFQLSFPAALLDFQSVAVAGTLTQDWIAVSGSENSPGVIQVGGFDFTPVTAGGLWLRVTFQVDSGAVGSGPISLSNFVDDFAAATTAGATFQTTVAAGASGLFGEYYDDLAFGGAVLQRIDPQVDFDWGTGAPAPSMGADDFSVRWTGWVQPAFTQTYTFYTLTDDGVRLWVNDQLVIDSWVDQASIERTGTIALSGETQVPIKMEFYERSGEAVAKLSWSSSSQAKQVVPSDRLQATPCVQGVGDVDASGVLGPADVACAFDAYLANQVAASGCNYPGTSCEVVSADVDCSGSVTPADARAIDARVASGLLPAPCFASVEPVPSPPYQLGLVQQVVDDGGTLRLAVLIVVEDATDLDAFGARLSFPGGQLQFNRVEPGFFTAGWHSVDGRSLAAGQMILGGFDTFTTAPAGTIDACRVYFDFLGAPGTVGGLSLSDFVDDFTGAVVGSVTSVDSPAPAPHRLHQNHPNPFNPTTQVPYEIGGRNGEIVRVRVAVYDVHGAKVRLLVDEDRAPGLYVATWDGRTDTGSEAASGVYFYAMRAGTYVESRRMVLLK